MKKILSLLLAALMLLTFAACSSEDDVSNKIEEYVNTNEDDIISSVKKGLSNETANCTYSITVDGNSFLVYIYLNDMNDLTEIDKVAYQAGYNSMQSVFDNMLANWRKDIPELVSVKFNICEVDGDLIAIIDSY